ncbi:unnamed protein product [Ceratitis capitata]|uniref:(Mediterranean fruit fly) hypothetical protein n=1 Tax=Ceratitis capitata TaxID=7213 RepID=A0A811UR80_CERCA|nr:unnamed protein product [Ceratitis capitata]
MDRDPTGDFAFPSREIYFFLPSSTERREVVNFLLITCEGRKTQSTAMAPHAELSFAQSFTSSTVLNSPNSSVILYCSHNTHQWSNQ